MFANIQRILPYVWNVFTLFQLCGDTWSAYKRSTRSDKVDQHFKLCVCVLVCVFWHLTIFVSRDRTLLNDVNIWPKDQFTYRHFSHANITFLIYIIQRPVDQRKRSEKKNRGRSKRESKSAKSCFAFIDNSFSSTNFKRKFMSWISHTFVSDLPKNKERRRFHGTCFEAFQIVYFFISGVDIITCKLKCSFFFLKNNFCIHQTYAEVQDLTCTFLLVYCL